MIKILIVHSSGFKNKTIERNLISKYPFLNHEAFELTIYKLHGKEKYKFSTEFNKLYFDVESIKTQEIYPFVLKNPKATICWFSSTGNDDNIKKYTTNIGTVIKMEKSNDI